MSKIPFFVWFLYLALLYIYLMALMKIHKYITRMLFFVKKTFLLYTLQYMYLFN